MKKFIAVIAALSACALMLTACENKTTVGDSILIDDIPEAEDTNNTDNDDILLDYIPDADDAEINETDTDETTAAEPESFEVSVSYTSLDEFVKADDIFDIDGDLVDGENTNTYNFINSLDIENGSGFYIDIESSDGSMKARMAAEEKKIAITMIGDGINMSMIMKDGAMYMILPESKKAVYTELDEDMFDTFFVQYSAEDIFGDAVDTDASDIAGMVSYNVDIGGRIYTFEYMDGTGFLFDSTGKLCTIVNGQTGAEFIINEFTLNIPADAFDVPSDYEVVDIASLDESDRAELLRLLENISLL